MWIETVQFIAALAVGLAMWVTDFASKCAKDHARSSGSVCSRRKAVSLAFEQLLVVPRDSIGRRKSSFIRHARDKMRRDQAKGQVRVKKHEVSLPVFSLSPSSASYIQNHPLEIHKHAFRLWTP